ncbi:MAG: 3-methyl-2-oxobutanoate dehydrogenase subunit beta [Thermoplasmata archaeon]|nr:3-methyl-2-oxobutanoate dehydrogenase subunit beta [Thermoplasmata archaeon]
MGKTTIPEEELMHPGHIACLGCGGGLAMRYMLKALGRRTIVSVPACCWAIMHGKHPSFALDVPLVNTAFEVTGASISGIRAALDAKGIKDVNVVGFAGDGGTVDIGIQALSGAVERNTDIFYVMYDNEAYMNTGIQRSGATPEGAWTTTTPVGTTGDWKKGPKKNMVEIMVAHDIPYTATVNVAFPEDFVKKIAKGKDIVGPKFYHAFAPCPTGWRHPPEHMVKIAKMAVDSNLFPLFEVEKGKYRITRKPKKKIPVKDYLRLQGRFRHLPEDVIEKIQRGADRNWELLLRKEEFTADF